MDDRLIVATRDGLAICERDGSSWREAQRSLNGRAITSVVASQGMILAGTRQGILRSDDGGDNWQEASHGLTTPHVRWLASHPKTAALVFAGTEPAGIFISHDAGGSWHLCPEVAALRDERGWSLPYSPEAGCVRGMAFNGQRGYAAAEVGGVLVSDDQGETWELARGSQFRSSFPPLGSVHPDVHSLEVHPSSPDLVYAPTGGGFYRSWDGGNTWELRFRCYCRAVWVDAHDPDHLILGPADGVDYNGRIESTQDGGRTWQPASTGLSVPWGRHMVERFVQVGEHLLAVLSNGQLLSASLETLSWEHILSHAGKVNAVASMTA